MFNALRVASRRRHPARLPQLFGTAARRGIITEGAEGQAEQSTAEVRHTICQTEVRLSTCSYSYPLLSDLRKKAFSLWTLCFQSGSAHGSTSSADPEKPKTLRSDRSLRHYIGIFLQEDLLGRTDSILRSVTTHGFKLLSLDPRSKDGGVFVNFSYDATNGEQALQEILKDIRTQSRARGGFPSWTGMNTGDIWFVQGRPWREVCSSLFVI